MIPLITLEEHFFSTEVAGDDNFTSLIRTIPGLVDRLGEIGPLRLANMDKGGVTVQVISHGPGLGRRSDSATGDKSLAQLCREANDQLAGAVKAHPDRFRGFAVLPMGDPQAAAAELRRAVKEHGFVGALVDNHSDGVHYDGSAYRVFWKAAQELDVPIYLHPTWPDESITPRFEGDLIDQASADAIGAYAFGWHIDTGLHILKLFASGLFDELPWLKVVIGHMGETLPFMLERISPIMSRRADRKHTFKQVWDENIWITTSGNWSLNPLATILRNTKIDHIMYSVDYPFAANEVGLAFMEELEKSGMVTPEQFEMIGYRNAEKLLKIKVSS